LNQFELTRTKGTPVSDDELIADLKAVSDILRKKTVTQRDYKKHGQFEYSTVIRHFGRWNDALTQAGLEIANHINYSNEELFENILNLWQHFGRQPRRIELTSEHSSISQSPYNRRFGSWTGALQEFVNYMNEEGVVPVSDQKIIKESPARKTGRDPSLRLRYKVLKRDGFKCVSCGASPATDAGVELQVDHNIPWSKGGETVIENLRTLCSRCNLGKSNTE
jgi:hypothetical protein